MNDTGMELDGLTPVIAAGPRGVQGGLLERLEREALAEAAAQATATAAAAAAANAASAGPSQHGAYVPGAAAKARKQQQQQAGPSSPSPSTSTIGSAAPVAAATTSVPLNGATQGECAAPRAIQEELKAA